MPLAAKTTGPEPRSLLAWQILAPVTALFFAFLLLGGLAARQYFEPLATEHDLLRVEHYAKATALLFGERLPGKTPRELSEEIWTAGPDTLEFVPAEQTPDWKSPRYLAAGPWVEAWSPVIASDGSKLGAVRLRRQADALVFVRNAVRHFALAACVAFLLLALLVWILLKRRVTDRLDAITREITTDESTHETGLDSVDQIGAKIAQRAAEAADKERDLRRFLDGHSELANIATPEGRLVDVNAAYCRFFGKKREELIGTNCLDLVHPAHRMEVINQLRSLSRARPEMETVHAVNRPDGSKSWVKWRAIAIPGPDGRTEHVISFRTEITEQRRAEDKLVALQAAFNQMQSLADTGSITWNLAREKMELTPEAKRLLGLGADRHSSLDDLLLAVATDDRESLRRHFAAAREEGREFECEFRAVLPDGSLRVLQTRAEVKADPDTKLLNQLTCTLRDITALRDAELSTKRELRFREAVESSLGVGVSVSDQKGRIILVNPAFCEMTGWSGDELIGLDAPYPYWPTEEVPAINRAFAQALRGETPAEGFELTFCRKDSSRFDVLVKVAPIFDSSDRQLGWLGTVTDISSIQETRRELARTGQELRRQLSYREALDKSTTVGLIALNEKGLPFAVNEAYCKMLGYTEAEVMRFAPPYPYWPEEERESIEQAFALHLEDKTPKEGFQLRFRKKSGAPIDVLVTASSISGPDGRPIGVLSALTDISPLQETRRELLMANERLQIAQDVMGLGIWDWDPAHDTLFWDRNSFALFGHPDATDPKYVWTAVHGEAERERLTYELERLIAAGATNGEDRLLIRWPDGTEHDILSTYVILRDESGKANRVIGVNRDITAELEEERELRHAQERLTAALEGGQYGTFEHIIGHGDVNWNATNYEINGVDPSVTDPSELFNLWKQGAVEVFPDLLDRMSKLSVDQRHLTYEFTACPPGKEPRRVRSSVFIERNKHGHPTRLVGITQRIG